MNRLSIALLAAGVVVAGLLVASKTEKAAEPSVSTSAIKESVAHPMPASSRIGQGSVHERNLAPANAEREENAEPESVEDDGAIGDTHNAEQAPASRSSVADEQMDPRSETNETSAKLENRSASDSSPGAPADDDFDFSKIQSLYMLEGDKGYHYSTFSTFLQYRELIVEKMRIAEESNIDFTTLLYEVRLVGIGEETTLYIGDSWIEDGEKSAPLSVEELNWLRQTYNIRTGSPESDRKEIEESIRRKLEQQRDPAWRPAP